MEVPKLTEAEQRCFGELFGSCDTDNQGWISASKAFELFLASQLPTDTLQQIRELCGARRLGHFGRSQFYIALKLIALAQTGQPPKLELLSSVTCAGAELPLPRFGGRAPEQNDKVPDFKYIVRYEIYVKSDLSIAPYFAPSIDRHRKLPASGRCLTSSISPKPWSLEVTWAQFEEHRHLLTAANDEDSSERHSSGGEEDGDCWTVTEEQREYYTTQFLNMQPDLKGKISGGVAKEFFEMSRLPVHELSRIWHLSDLDKDGALTLEEFCIAMHLVVLRRHQIDLPAETLPPSMLPPRKLPEASPPVAPITKLPPVTTPPTASSPPNKEWTKFNDSPTSSMSSPGMKPVNFDFPAASVEQDPRILHPVALRLSPDGQPNDIGHYPSLPDFMPLHGSGHLEWLEEVCSEPPINSSTPDTKKVNTGGSSVHRPVPRKPFSTILKHLRLLQREKKTETWIHSVFVYKQSGWYAPTPSYSFGKYNLFTIKIAIRDLAFFIYFIYYSGTSCTGHQVVEPILYQRVSNELKWLFL
ncbi:REPS1 [Cordylochernes scorpioides]|uniref:REPS1 n=1 Tax=Cordylochernes scorpioides TaxID=51811 RepID=A0ABY6LBE9_9ARAC|nr:REPS1 [Cordylochernes scorpioides]